MLRLFLVACVALATAGALAALLLRAPAAPTAPPPPPAPAGSGAFGPVVVLGERGGTPWDPSRHQGPVHIRLEAAGPRLARVWLEQELLGRIALDAEGRHSGDAIGRIMSVSRLLGNRKVIVRPDPALPRELGQGVANLVRLGGCLGVEVQAP